MEVKLQHLFLISLLQMCIRDRPTAPCTVEYAQEVLAGSHGFLCQPADPCLPFATVWSSVYDLAAGHVYRAEGDPAQVPFLPDDRLV